MKDSKLILIFIGVICILVGPGIWGDIFNIGNDISRFIGFLITIGAVFAFITLVLVRDDGVIWGLINAFLICGGLFCVLFFWSCSTYATNRHCKNNLWLDRFTYDGWWWRIICC